MAKPCIVKYKGKEYSVEQFSAMLHDGLLNNLIESGAIDQNKLKGDLTLLKADTGEVSFRFEKSGEATVAGAPEGTYLNIGLLKGETEEQISVDDVLSKLPSDIKVIKQREVTGTEPTLALQINRKMSDQEMEDFRNATAQMAIPQLSDGKGVIHGTQEWGEFNPEYFVLPNNKPLSSIKGVEVTSVKPNEEEPSFRKNYEVVDLNTFDLNTADGANKLVEKLEGKVLTENFFRDRKFGEDSPYINFVKVFNEGKVLKRKDIQLIISLYLDGLINNKDRSFGIADNTDIDKLFFESKKKVIKVRDVLSTIANRKESPYSKIADLLLKKGNTKGLDVVVAYSKRKGTSGFYSFNEDKITIGQGYSEKTTELIFIHEIVHGFTHKEVKKDQRTNIQKFNYDVKKGYEYLSDLNNYIDDDKANPYLKNLIEAYFHAVKQSGFTDKVFGRFEVINEKKDVPYGFINLDEFIAEAFSNPKFQQILNDIQMPGTKKTIWQTIVDAIRNILGLSVKQGSVLESALRNGAEIINKARGGVEGEQEPSFRKDDKVKGTYFEPAMTTDSKGNYVFFHFSTAPLKSLMKGIDSRKYYSTRTSREEKGLQYGVASYYTKPTDSENVVGGDKYYVTISPDKVYPMDLDPNGYRAAAEKKFKKNTPFRESRISKEIANAAARDGYEMAVGEWSYDRAGLTQSETPEFRGDALVPLKPTELTGKEKFKTGKERGIKTEHPDKARLAFNQQIEDLASDIDSYKFNKGKYDEAREIASTVMTYGGIIEDYGTKNERVRPLTIEEFDTMTKGLPAKLKERASKLRSQMEDNEELSMRIDDLWHGTPHKVGKFSTNFMGTGEGAQSFGWGLYFTDLKDIANTYRRTLSEAKLLKDGVEIKEDSYASSDAYSDGYNKNEGLYLIAIGLAQNFDKNKILKNLENKREAIKETSWTKDVEKKRLDSLNKTIEDFKNDRFTYSAGGNLYKVSLHEGKTPEQYTYLEWYKKPNKQQVENLFSKLTKEQLDKGFYYGLKPDATNADLYKGLSKSLGSDKAASLFLLENGIDGIKFPAESISRGATDENARGFNYVVFDENAISIQDEISFRADMGQRRITSNPRLMAMLRGANFKDLRNVINISPDSFYTPQKYAQLKPQIASMSDAELLAAIDVETSLEDIFNNTDGPIIGLAFIEYINRLKNIVEDPNSTQDDIDNANELIQKAYESVAPFTTKVAQVLRQLGEIKSTIKKDEVQFYLDMIEALIEANGNMINDDHREALKGVIEVLLNSKKEHAAIFEDLANKGNNVTDQDIVDLNVAEVEMQNAHAALNMLVGFLSPPSSQDFWSGVMRGNLMSIRSALTGLYSNLLNIGVFRFRNLVQATLSIPFAMLKKAGVNTFGLEKYQFFNTPIVSNIKYGLFLDVIQDALVGVAKAIATLSKMMIGKESFRGFLDKSPTANRVFNIIKYGSSGIEGGSPVILDKSNHTMTAIRKAMTPKGGKTKLNIRGMKMDVASSFKKVEFSKWFKANYPGSDYNSLSAKDKKIIQNEYFNDPKAMVPTFGGKIAGLGRAVMAVNSEFVFRLVALSDYLPKTYANNVEMTRLAQTLGLDEKQTILFMKDPARYIEIMSNVLSPEALNFWIDTVNEVTVTKDTGLGKASTAFVEALKNYVPKKLMDKFPALKDDKWFKSFVGLWQFGIDSVVPFVKIPMNAISLTADFLIPSKPLIKAIYFSGLALNNKGTDQAEAYALSAMKNYSMAIVALGIRSLAVGLVAIPGMVVLAPGKDDDDEKKKMKSKFSRMSININALRRYFSGEDPSYKEGDKYESLIAYGILGMVIYNYASIGETSNKEYYDQLSKAPKNVNPKDVVTGSPFDIAKSGALELELKAFQSSQFFIDQSWFVGLNSALEGVTGGDTGRDKFVNNYIGTLLSLWWGFSSHAQQISDIYREATGKPVFDVTLPTELQGLNKQGYPGILGDRVWNNIFKKNELIHQALINAPEDKEYVKFSMYGEPMTPVPGNTKNNLEVVLSVAAPARRVTPNLTKEERLYMAVYENKNKINIPGYTASLTEPTLNKTEKIKVFMPGEDEAESINVMIMPKEYNKVNKMAGEALRDLHTVLLSEQGLLDYEVRGKVISPEDIMSKNWGNTREVANVRNAIAVAFSEGNKLLTTFLKPWELFGDDITKYIGKDNTATIQDAYSLIDSKISEYKVLNPNTGKMEMLSNYLVGHPELSNKLYALAKESISIYLKAAEEAIKNNEEWNKTRDNPEMTIEQEKARKEGNF